MDGPLEMVAGLMLRFALVNADGQWSRTLRSLDSWTYSSPFPILQPSFMVHGLSSIEFKGNNKAYTAKLGVFTLSGSANPTKLLHFFNKMKFISCLASPWSMHVLMELRLRHDRWDEWVNADSRVRLVGWLFGPCAPWIWSPSSLLSTLGDREMSIATTLHDSILSRKYIRIRIQNTILVQYRQTKVSQNKVLL